MTVVRPHIITRKEWGAAPPKSVTKLHRSQVEGVVNHYSAGAQPKHHNQCFAVVRQFQRMHMAPGGLGTENGGADIAYNWVVCPHGKTFRGRGIDVRSGANGTTAANSAFYAVCTIALDNPDIKDITPEARAELLRLLLWLDTLIEPGGRRMRVPPHRKFKNTACPGDELVALVRAAGWPQ